MLPPTSLSLFWRLRLMLYRWCWWCILWSTTHAIESISSIVRIIITVVIHHHWRRWSTRQIIIICSTCIRHWTTLLLHRSIANIIIPSVISSSRLLPNAKSGCWRGRQARRRWWAWHCLTLLYEGTSTEHTTYRLPKIFAKN